MALAMTPAMVSANDDMDIDIDMDVEDTMPMIDGELLEEGEQSSFQITGLSDNTGIIPAIYTEDPALEPMWQKVHLAGLDDFKEAEVRAFSKEHFPDGDPHVEWINDTACNLVFKHKDIARQALLAYMQTPVDSATIVNTPLEPRQTKTFSQRPASLLTVRVAKAGDRKKRGAYLESRFYLMNPGLDPSARIERDGSRSGRGGRGSSNNDYRKRRYDDREDRKRRGQDHNADIENFDASMYDDAPAPDIRAAASRRGRDRSTRVSRSRRRSASPGAISLPSSDDDGRLNEGGGRRRGNYRNRESPPTYSKRDPHPFPRKNMGKELFSADSSSGNAQKPDAMDITSSLVAPQSQRSAMQTPQQNQTNKAAASRLKADLIASAGQQSPRNGHRRSRAMDSRNAEDLSERFARKSISQDSTKSINAQTANSGIELFPTLGSNVGNGNGGLSIKGGAGFSFKGRAGSEAVKELFPEQYKAGGAGSNRGKELFDNPVRQRNTRQRAGDLFD